MKRPSAMKTSRLISALAALALAAALLPVALYLSNTYDRYLIARERAYYSSVAARYRDALQSGVRSRVALLDGLRAFAESKISSSAGKFPEDDFLVLAGGLYRTTSGVRSVAVAPGQVVRYVYPLTGNEQILNQNLLSETSSPEQRTAIDRSIRTRQISLSGPYRTPGGALELYAYQSVRLYEEQWGMLETVLDMRTLLSEANIQPFVDQYELAMRNDEGTVFLGFDSVFERSPVIEPVTIENETWDIAIVPRGGWNAVITVSQRMFRLFGGLIVLLFSVLLYFILSRQADLTRAVQERTSELANELQERLRTEEALRVSESRMRQVVQNMPVMMNAFDEAGNVIVWNGECERVTGYSAAEVVGHQRVYEWLYPDTEYRERMLTAWKNRGNNYYGWEWNITRRDGQKRVISWSNISDVYPIPGWASWGLGIDVTERNQAADATRLSMEHRLRYQMELLDLARLDNTDLDSFIDAMTETVARVLMVERVSLWQYSADKSQLVCTHLFLKSHNRHLHGTDELVVADIQRYLWMMQNRLVLTASDTHTDGNLVELQQYYQSTGVNSMMEAGVFQRGELLGVVSVEHTGLPRDWSNEESEFTITVAELTSLALESAHRHQAELALIDSEKRYRTLYETTTDAVFLESYDGRILDCNQAALQMYGYTREEMLSRLVSQTLPAEDHHLLNENLLRKVESENILMEARGLRKDGSVFPAEVSARAMLLGGEWVVVAQIRDTSQLKQREREQAAIAELASALRTAITPGEVIPRLLQELIEINAAQASALFVEDTHTHEAVCLHGEGLWSNLTGLRIPPGKGTNGIVLRTGKPYNCRDVKNSPDFYNPDALGDIRMAAATPLRIEDTMSAVLWVGWLDRFEDYHLRLLQAVTDMAASSLHRAALFEEVQHRMERVSALRQIDTAINASLDLQVTLNVLLEQLMAQLGGDAARVMLMDDDSHRLRALAARGFRVGTGTLSENETDEGYAGQVVLKVAPLFITNTTENREHAGGQNMGYYAYHGVPLVTKGVVKGVLEVFHVQPFQPDGEWLDFLTMLADQAAIAIDNALLFTGLQRTNAELAQAYDTTLEGWARALELRDRETEGHVRRVVNNTLMLCQVMGVPEEQMIHIRRGVLLHDIGKIGIPDNILLKAGPLTDTEWEVMRRHPVYAYNLLSPIQYLQPALDIPYCHHERWDGSGYPQGLRGEAIPLPARVFAVLDAWDALLSDRPYRKAWPVEQVTAYLQAEAGRLFDPYVVEVFLQMRTEGRIA